MTGALVVSWGRVVPTRERKALEVFAAFQGLWEDLEKEGEIVGHRAYFGSVRGANGCEIVEGSIERLQAIQRTDDFRRLLVQAGAIVENLQVDLMEGGTDASVQSLLATYTEALGALGYM